MNAQELRNEAEKMRTRAKSAKDDVERANVNVAGHKEMGNDNAVDVERDRARSLEQQADDLERQAGALDDEATQKELLAVDIERQQETVRKEMEGKLDDLEKQKRDLRGGSVGWF
jgi:hypothetical protein